MGKQSWIRSSRCARALLACVLAVPLPVRAELGFLSTSSVGDSESRRAEFVSALTTLESVSYNGVAEQVRAVHSSGGAAGGVVTEGQGYGLLIGGATLAGMTPTASDAAWDVAVQQTYETYLGWRQMCRLSRGGASCQSPYYCGARCPIAGSTTDPECYPCLPHWKFTDDLSTIVGSGAAPDGDEDAIVGMILLVLATAPVKERYTWWTEVATVTYQSCKQFYTSNTVDGSGLNQGLRILKLGSCWGGFGPEQCNNPSYHAPGAMRAMRDYMAAYSPLVGAGDEGDAYVPLWNTVVETTYLMLKDNQCEATGLTTNWFETGTPLGRGLGSTGCSGSGTPASEFGSEASRGVWRVALDSLWYSDETVVGGGPDLGPGGTDFGPQAYLERVVAQVSSKHISGASCPSCWSSNLDTPAGCFVDSIHPSWNWNAFMCGPVFSSLVREVASVGLPSQEAALDAAGETIRSFSIDHYYSGSWVAISTLTLNGDFEKAREVVRAMRPVGPTSPPTPAPPAVPTVSPTAALPTPSPPSSPTPTEAPTAAFGGDCYLQDCGCPPDFAGGASWCTEASGHLAGGWCKASGAQCGVCGGVWCAAPPAVNPTPAPTLEPTSTEAPTRAPTDAPSPAPPTSTPEPTIAPPPLTLAPSPAPPLTDEPTASPSTPAPTSATPAPSPVPSSTATPSRAPTAAPTFTLAPTVAPTGRPTQSDGELCFIKQCGCKPFTQPWCNQDNARVVTEWCQENAGQCTQCNGEWCSARRLQHEFDMTPLLVV